MLPEPMDEQALGNAFRDALPETVELGLDPDELERRLAEGLHAAQTRYSELSLETSSFLHYVAERYQEPKQLAPTTLADLYLCAAAAAGDERAVQRFERELIPEIAPALNRLRMTQVEREELHQRLAEELFVARPDRRAKIAEYSGLGDLRGWLKVTAMRLGLKVLRGREHHEDADELLQGRAMDGEDAELMLIKAQYRSAFKIAFQDALDALPARDRLLLKQHLLDGLSIDDLAGLHGVHRATTARWLSAARTELLASTRRGLMQAADISIRECNSVMKLVQSQLDATIRRRLSET